MKTEDRITLGRAKSIADLAVAGPASWGAEAERSR
jgi:hypothetical protein